MASCSHHQNQVIIHLVDHEDWAHDIHRPNLVLHRYPMDPMDGKMVAMTSIHNQCKSIQIIYLKLPCAIQASEDFLELLRHNNWLFLHLCPRC